MAAIGSSAEEEKRQNQSGPPLSPSPREAHVTLSANQAPGHLGPESFRESFAAANVQSSEESTGAT